MSSSDSSYGGVSQPRKPDPRAGVARHDSCAYCIPQAEGGLLLRLQNRVRYAEQVESLRHDLKCLEEERLKAMACGDMQELATLDAAAPEYRWKLEATQDMVEFLTGCNRRHSSSSSAPAALVGPLGRAYSAPLSLSISLEARARPSSAQGCGS